MSAAIASRRRPSRMASAMKGSSSTIKTRMLRCYEVAHVVGISKTGYVPATPRCLDWRYELLPPTATNNDPSDSDSQEPCHRLVDRHRGDRRTSRLPLAGIVVLDARITHRGAPGTALRGG